MLYTVFMYKFDYSHLWIILGVTGSACLWVFRTPTVSQFSAGLALATLWLALVPTVLFLCKRCPTPMPFLALTGIYYGVFYGLSSFFHIRPKSTQTDPTKELDYGIYLQQINLEAQILVLVGLMLMIGTFYFIWRYASRMPYFCLPENYSIDRLRLLVWGLVAIDCLWRAVPEIQQIPSVGQFVKPAGFLAIGLLVLMSLRKELSWFENAILFLLVFPVVIVHALVSGLLTGLAMQFGFIMIILMYTRTRAFWVVGFGTILLVVVLYPGLSAYRSLTWEAPPKNNITKVSLLLKQTKLAWQRDDKYQASTLEPLVRRISSYLYMSRVVSWTPSEVPYWTGKSYKPLFTSYIPRALWPDKPEERTGGEFGHRYRFLHLNDNITSLNLPWIVEMYANFGRWGVLIGMTLVGGFLAFLSGFFNRREMSAHEFVIGASIIFPLAYPESNFSLSTGSLLPLAVCLWLYFRVGLISRAS